jgi:hypothetical protein
MTASFTEIQQALRVRQFCTACGVRVQQCLGLSLDGVEMF